MHQVWTQIWVDRISEIKFRVAICDNKEIWRLEGLRQVGKLQQTLIRHDADTETSAYDSYITEDGSSPISLIRNQWRPSGRKPITSVAGPVMLIPGFSAGRCFATE